jgi:hypothetical protein
LIERYLFSKVDLSWYQPFLIIRAVENSKLKQSDQVRPLPFTHQTQ